MGKNGQFDTIGKNGQFDTMGKSWQFVAEKIGIAHFNVFIGNFVEIMYPLTPGLARAHGKSKFLGRQVMFGLEKLGSVHFSAKKCYVLLILIKENIPSANFLRCQIVRGVKLSAVSNCPVSKCPVSNCPRIFLVSPNSSFQALLKNLLKNFVKNLLTKSSDRISLMS